MSPIKQHQHMRHSHTKSQAITNKWKNVAKWWLYDLNTLRKTHVHEIYIPFQSDSSRIHGQTYSKSDQTNNGIIPAEERHASFLDRRAVWLTRAQWKTPEHNWPDLCHTCSSLDNSALHQHNKPPNTTNTFIYILKNSIFELLKTFIMHNYNSIAEHKKAGWDANHHWHCMCNLSIFITIPN